MEMLGAKVVPVTSGSRTLKDAVNEAIRDWVTNVENTYYIIENMGINYDILTCACFLLLQYPYCRGLRNIYAYF